jgi:class 3 adenylate cyclase
MHQRLQTYADAIARLDWAAMLLDDQDRLAWLSDDFKHFVHEYDEVALGVGEHVVHALLKDPYLATMTPESVVELTVTTLPYFVASMPGGIAGVDAELPPGIPELLDDIEEREAPEHWNGRFGYMQPGLASYEVRFLVSRIRDDNGTPIGWAILTTVGLPAPLVALLAAGDAAMYERMVRLVEPSRHQAAIVFADLQGSAELSRRLPTAVYFQLVRELTADFDRLVGAHCGVVGNHAGDGMTAFFLAEDGGSPAAAAASALRAAREFQEGAGPIAARLLPPDVEVLVNVGAHWGAGLYIGQLVPGGRLEVTALGDEVNETARIQQTARDGALLASKHLLELLEPAAAASLGIAKDALLYAPLEQVPGAGPKAVRDAGHIPVAAL